jgi:hypothetical protein
MRTMMVVAAAAAVSGCSDSSPTVTVAEAQAREVCDPVTAQSNASDALRSQLPQDGGARCAAACNANDGSREFLDVDDHCVANGAECLIGLTVIYHGLAGCCALVGDGAGRPSELELVPCE